MQLIYSEEKNKRVEKDSVYFAKYMADQASANNEGCSSFTEPYQECTKKALKEELNHSQSSANRVELFAGVSAFLVAS